MFFMKLDPQNSQEIVSKSNPGMNKNFIQQDQVWIFLGMKDIFQVLYQYLKISQSNTLSQHHMIISTNRETIFDKIPHLFMIKKKNLSDKKEEREISTT